MATHLVILASRASMLLDLFLAKKVSYTLVASVTEAVKMRDIARNARMDIQLLKYDKDGCLTLVESPS